MRKLADSRWAIIAATVFLLILFFVPLGSGRHNLIEERLSDAAHVMLFFILSLLLGNLRLPPLIPNVRSINGCLWALLFAVGIELTQPLTGRSASWVDLENGLLGVLSAVAFVLIRGRRGGLVLPVGLLFFAQTLSLLPAYNELRVEQVQLQALPRISVFENRLGLSLWRAYGGASIKSGASKPGLHLKFAARNRNSAFSGVEYLARYLDLRPYIAVRFNLYNPGDSIALTLRVDDAEKCTDYDQRFNRSVVIPHGYSDLRVHTEDIEHGPRSRELDISQIKRILLFADSRQFPSSPATEDRSLRITIISASLEQLQS
jgi:VanZ family protein